MLTKEEINKLKADWLSFEQVNELEKRLEEIDNWTAKFLSEDEFWSRVTNRINSKMKNKCIK